MNPNPRRLGLTLTLILCGLTVSAAPPASTPSRPRSAAVRAAPPLAERLCEALHAIPSSRKKECCGWEPASLARVCAGELSAALGRGSVTLDAGAIERCAAETGKRLEGCSWVRPQLPPLPPECAGVIRGSLKAASPCRSSLECPEGLYCRGLSPTRPGACGPPAAPRARCENPADSLASFTRAKDDPRHPQCQGRCVKGQCIGFAPAGAACTSTLGCTPGLHCIAGSCADRPAPGIGEPCPEKTACAEGAFCQAGRCVATRDAGEPCALPFECRALACNRAPGARTGTCADPCARPGLAPTPPAQPAGAPAATR